MGLAEPQANQSSHALGSWWLLCLALVGGVEIVRPLQRPSPLQCRPGAQDLTEHRDTLRLMVVRLCRPQASVRPRGGEERARPPSLERLSIPEHTRPWPLVDLGAPLEAGKSG